MQRVSTTYDFPKVGSGLDNSDRRTHAGRLRPPAAIRATPCSGGGRHYGNDQAGCLDHRITGADVPLPGCGNPSPGLTA